MPPYLSSCIFLLLTDLTNTASENRHRICSVKEGCMSLNSFLSWFIYHLVRPLVTRACVLPFSKENKCQLMNLKARAWEGVGKVRFSVMSSCQRMSCQEWVPPKRILPKPKGPGLGEICSRHGLESTSFHSCPWWMKHGHKFLVTLPPSLARGADWPRGCLSQVKSLCQFPAWDLRWSLSFPCCVCWEPWATLLQRPGGKERSGAPMRRKRPRVPVLSIPGTVDPAVTWLQTQERAHAQPAEEPPGQPTDLRAMKMIVVSC